MTALTQGKFRIKATVQLNYKVKYSREGKWLIAEVPELTLATQGRTPKELEENLIDIVKDYTEDPHTPKPMKKIQITFTKSSNPRGMLNDDKTKTYVKT